MQTALRYRSAFLRREYSAVVYGANTDVGKTLVSCGILRASVGQSVTSLYIKPVQTGPTTDEAWVTANVGTPQAARTLYSYTEPLSPHIAAALDGVVPPTDAELLTRVEAEIRSSEHAMQLVETAGGVLSPAPSGTPQADVYAALQARSVLVGDPVLGGISTTLCALEALSQRGVDVAAVVFVGGDANAATLQELRPDLPVVVLADIPPQELPLTEWYADDANGSRFVEILSHITPQTEEASEDADEAFDKAHIWHPYTSMARPNPTWEVVHARGTRITLRNGVQLIDGMSSWWSTIHGYNHPVLNRAVSAQLHSFSHVMFGGLRHAPATRLCRQLVEMTPGPLECVFLADSGSVAVEAAMKMAVQYWMGRGAGEKKKLVSVRRGYHGDTLGAMSVCDPVNSMHSLFKGALVEHHFIDSLDTLRSTLEAHHAEIAALILEPIVQGAGGMLFHPPEQLAEARRVCDEYNVLLIADEIATGFGRTGELFACNHADIVPDIMCLGKALTGGYMTLSAVVTTRHVADGVSGDDGTLPFMHGPTFMGNPLACSVASASLELLQSSPWKQSVARIASTLETHLAPARGHATVHDVRVKGAIGVIELKEVPQSPQSLQAALVAKGVWVRPFGKLVYVMPPYIMEDEELKILAEAMCEVVATAW